MSSDSASRDVCDCLHFIVMIHDCNGSRRKNPRDGNLTSSLQWIICFMDVVCKSVTTDMDTWSAFAGGLHLSSTKITFFWGVFQVRRHHLTAQIFLKDGRDINPCPITSWILADLQCCDSASRSK